MKKEEFRRRVFSLSEQLYPMVFRMLGSRANTQDAIQEIMLKLWLKRDQVDKHPNLKGLVFMTARNHCIDILRKKNLQIHDQTVLMEVIRSEDGQDDLEWKELNLLIRKFLDSLPENQREVLIMRDLDGYQFEEIAAATQLNVPHVRVLLSRARKQLSLHLEKIYSYEGK